MVINKFKSFAVLGLGILLIGCATNKEYKRHQNNTAKLEDSNARISILQDSLVIVEEVLSRVPDDHTAQEQYNSLTLRLELEQSNQRSLMEQTSSYHKDNMWSDTPEQAQEREKRNRREGR